jgi:AcrR family transcriptional regulator
VQLRSKATRAALLDAAIDCLCAKGYAAVTTTDIAGRAGVSRGAQLHHFSSKAELLTAAIDHLLERRVEEFGRLLASDWADAPDLVEVLIDRLWSMFEGPTYIAWTELWLAARTDRDLAATMVEVDRRFTETTRAMSVELVSALGRYDPATLELLRDFCFAVMGGMAFQRMVPRGQRPASDYLTVLKQQARRMLADHTEPRER